MRICFIRHGETNWNSQSLIQGQINNPLNANGIKQAENLADKLIELGTNWDVFFSSPLSRAFDTANIVAKKMQFQSAIIVDKKLIERDFGKIEGMQLSDKVYDLIISESEPTLEKVDLLKLRIINFIKSSYKKYPSKNILAFTHSHIIKGLKYTLDSNYSFRNSLSNCSLFQIEYDGKKIKEINF